MNLTRVLRGHKAGRWVVLDKDLKKVLSDGRDPEQALKRAGEQVKREHVLLRVPDPDTVCIY